MFEHSLIDLETQRQPKRRRWISLPIAIGLHVVGLTAFAFASYWSVSEVPEPDVNVVFFQLAPLPELPGGGGGGRPQKQPEKAPEQPAPRPPETKELVQPTEQTVPEAVPAPASAAPLDPVLTGLDEGPASGDGGPGSGDCILCPSGPGVGPGQVGIGEGPGGEGESLAPVRYSVGMTRPETLQRVQPRYTEAARKAGVQGTVIVEAIIDEKGNVTDARVLRGLPLGLDRAAVEAILQWKFKPAMLNDRPVKVYFNLTATFTLQR